jgi:hypothetical protein
VKPSSVPSEVALLGWCSTVSSLPANNNLKLTESNFHLYRKFERTVLENVEGRLACCVRRVGLWPWPFDFRRGGKIAIIYDLFLCIFFLSYLVALYAARTGVPTRGTPCRPRCQDDIWSRSTASKVCAVILSSAFLIPSTLNSAHRTPSSFTPVSPSSSAKCMKFQILHRESISFVCFFVVL